MIFSPSFKGRKKYAVASTAATVKKKRSMAAIMATEPGGTRKIRITPIRFIVIQHANYLSPVTFFTFVEQ